MNCGNPLLGWPSQSMPILDQSPICTFEDKLSAESQVTKIPISAILLSLHSQTQDQKELAEMPHKEALTKGQKYLLR